MADLGIRRDEDALVHEQSEVLVSRLLDYLRQPSVSATGEGFPEATERALREVEAAGLQASTLVAGGRPLVVGRREGPPGSRHVLIYGHYDVQPPGDAADWDSPAFEPEIRDGRIWGRGSGDNKGQHFAHLQALRLLGEQFGGLPCSVTVILDGEEEIGSPTLPRILTENRDQFDVDLVIWSDRSVHESGQWALLHGVRGSLQVRIEAHGANRALHSGNFGNVAANPAWTLVLALATMREREGRVIVPGFDAGIEPLPVSDRTAFENLPLDLDATLTAVGLSEMDPIYEPYTFYERLSEVPTLTINGLHSGAFDSTIIPASAAAELDIRLISGQDPDVVYRAITDHLRIHAPNVTVSNLGGSPASRTPIDNPYTPRIARAIARVTGVEPLLIPAYGGTLPDWVFTRILGVPSIGFPLANADQANHAPNENLRVDYYLNAVALSMEVLREIGTA